MPLVPAMIEDTVRNAKRGGAVMEDFVIKQIAEALVNVTVRWPIYFVLMRLVINSGVPQWANFPVPSIRQTAVISAAFVVFSR